MAWIRQSKRKPTNPRLPKILIISLGFLLILIGKADLSAVRYAQGGLVELVAPLYNIVAAPIRSIETLFEGVQTVATLRADAKRLLAENNRLVRWQRRAESLETENRQLRSVLGAVVPSNWNATTARAIVVPGGSFTRSLIIEHGTGHNIQRGSAVITADGLVGYIISPGRYFSRVLLISDVNARVPVVLSGSSWPG